MKANLIKKISSNEFEKSFLFDVVIPPLSSKWQPKKFIF